MTDRDMFAAAALTGLLSFGIELWPFRNVKKAAKLAYEYADAMIDASIGTKPLQAPKNVETKIRP